MNCTNCNAEIKEGMSFCTNCGTPIDATTTPHADNPADATKLQQSTQAEEAANTYNTDAHAQQAQQPPFDQPGQNKNNTASLPASQSPSSNQTEAPKKNRAIKIACIAVIALAVIAIIAILVWQFFENEKAHEPISLHMQAIITDTNIDETSGVPLRIQGIDLDNNQVDQKVLITTNDESVELLRGNYTLTIAGYPVGDSGKLYCSTSPEISLEIAANQITINEQTFEETEEESAEASSELTVEFTTVPVGQITDEMLQEVREWMSDFGIDQEKIDTFINAATEYRHTELKRIAEEEARAKAEALRKAAFGRFPASFSYSSGAGAWGALLEIQSDGSFKEDFHDMNAGESGPGYTGTLHCASFAGSFTVVEQVNATTFKLQLNELHSTHKAGESIDSEGIRTVYYDNESGGLGKATKSPVQGFTLYLPGTSRSALPEQSQEWLRDKSTTLNQMVIVTPEGVTWVATS